MRVTIALLILALGGCATHPSHQPETTGITSTTPGTAAAKVRAREPQNSILGPLYRDDRGRALLPKDVVARLDEELRWSVFMEQVFRVTLFRGSVDFKPVYDSLGKLQVHATTADSLTHNLAEAPALEREWYVKKIEDQVTKAHEYRVKACAEMYKLLPTEIDPFEADIELLSGK